MKYAPGANDKVSAKLPGWRASVLFAVLLLCLAGLTGRAVYLQGIHDDFLQERAISAIAGLLRSVRTAA
jgi:cell division protein FtsI (penicillin-binding protein 3)